MNTLKAIFKATLLVIAGLAAVLSGISLMYLLSQYFEIVAPILVGIIIIVIWIVAFVHYKEG